MLIYIVGYVVQGSNGEYVYQTAEERVKVVEHVAKTATSDKVIMAGSGCECKSLAKNSGTCFQIIAENRKNLS